MDKQALISYLDAVCDAESAVQACEDAIAVYNAQRHVIHFPTKPNEPTKSISKFSTQNTGSIGWILGAIIGAIVWWNLFYVECDTFSDKVGTIIVLLPICGILFSGVIGIIISCIHAKVKQTSQQAEFDSEYTEACLQHEADLIIYQTNLQVTNSMATSLAASIQKQTTLRDSSKTKLQKLYSMNILHPSCQNLIAAYQIREYLQMGICDTLDGPTGAYAQYMNDVRTARICNSITDLKRSLTSALHSLQSTLVHELRTVDSNLSDLRRDMSASMNDLNNRMQQMHNSTHAQLESHYAEANRLLSRMNENTSVIAHNQYVEQRLRNVDTYLLKAPRRI